MAKKMKRSGKRRHHSPSPKAKKAYYRLIEKGAANTMRALKKHNPAAAERIAHSVL